jgi:hypothetical protein
MATQQELLKLTGKIGDLIHYRSRKKFLTKTAPTEVKQTEDTKKSAKDFGTATKWAGIVRKLCGNLTKTHADDDVINRLNKLFINTLKTAPVELKGNKQLRDANLNLLQGFELNRWTAFDKLVLQAPQFLFNSTGDCKVSFNAMPMAKTVIAPRNADEVVFELVLINLELNGEQYEKFTPHPLQVPLDQAMPSASIKLELDLSGNRLLLLMAGVSFKSGKLHINDRSKYASKILLAKHLIDGKEVVFEPSIPAPIKTEEQPQSNLGWEFG